MAQRTYVIGDIHGELELLDRLLGRLPARDAGDTLVFLGDYLDRGPDSRGVVERVRALAASDAGSVVCLRGNHEDKWIESYDEPDAPYLVQVANGCGATYRSFTGGAPLTGAEDRTIDIDEYPRMLAVAEWFPAEAVAWLRSLPLWYEDAHAIYVHAGLERERSDDETAPPRWKHPRASSPQPLLWMREPSFYAEYRGKRVVFGHTPVDELPLERAGLAPANGEVWRGEAVTGIDTGSGKGGFLSCLELPSMTAFDSR